MLLPTTDTGDVKSDRARTADLNWTGRALLGSGRGIERPRPIRGWFTVGLAPIGIKMLTQLTACHICPLQEELVIYCVAHGASQYDIRLGV